MNYSTATAFAALGFIVWYILKQIRRQSIAYLPGPPSTSWLVGNVPNFQRAKNAGDADFEWTREYGLAFRVAGCFGEQVLYLADPKALQYILHKRSYNFPKTYEIRARTRLTTGQGIVFADGTQHARHRRIMNPSFSHSALKGFLPLFVDIARRTVDNWKITLHQQKEESGVLDVSRRLSKTTLDAIGEAAFGYELNTIDGEVETELHRAYQNLFVDTNHMLSDFTIAFRRIWGHIPLWLSRALYFLPKKDLRRLRQYMQVARHVAKEIVDREMKAHTGGKGGGKDVMSIFIKANSSEDPKRRLGEDEVLSQITLLLAGHETTANTLSWVLYELSKHREAQSKLRDEIRALRASVAARGDKEITISDLDSMKYTIAVMKETLRYHPIVLQIFRMAGQDDVIPLENAQRTLSGDMTTAIPVSKGQVVQLSICSYNRLKSLWGGDADEWRPERFLEDLPNAQKTSLGVFGNLATFSSGVRSCIGWRFSLIEMQAILIELIEKFEVSPAPGNIEIKRAVNGLMQPMVVGQESEGTQMPLMVTTV